MEVLENLPYRAEEAWTYAEAWKDILEYAKKKGLNNTQKALFIVRSLHDGDHRGFAQGPDGEKYPMPFVNHCLQVCRLLMDLQFPLSAGDEDILLASALCHDVIGHVALPGQGRELTEDYGLDPEIYRIVVLVTCPVNPTEKEHQEFFDRMQLHPLALLVKLSDRSNIVEQLYNVSPWKAKEYIYETRTYHIPMALYGREHFPELDTGISTMIAKLRLLTEVTEVLSERYDRREKELKTEINALREENILIRRMIRQLQTEDAAQ